MGQRCVPFVANPQPPGSLSKWPGLGFMPGWQGRRRRRLRAAAAGVGVGASISTEDCVMGSGDSESQGSGARALPPPLPPTPRRKTRGMVSQASVAHFGYLSRYTIPPARPREGGAAGLRPLAALMQPVLS